MSCWSAPGSEATAGLIFYPSLSALPSRPNLAPIFLCPWPGSPNEGGRRGITLTNNEQLLSTTDNCDTLVLSNQLFAESEGARPSEAKQWKLNRVAS